MPSRIDFSPDPYTDDGDVYSAGNLTNPFKEDKPYTGNYTTKTCKLVVTYYGNGASGTPPEQSVVTYSGEKQAISLSRMVKGPTDANFVKSGYSFIGWSTSSSSSVVEYSPGDVITKEWAENESGIVYYNLYAVWTNAGRIIYKPGRYATEASRAWHDKYGIISASLRGATYTRIGYTQTAWLENDPNGSITINGSNYNRYNLGSTYTGSQTNDAVLYPEWTPNVYTLTFKPNEGVGSDNIVSVTYDDYITMPNESIFDHDGYHIFMWNERQDGSGTNWIPNTEYKFTRTQNITLYAIWKGDEYRVIYNDGDATDGSAYSIAVYGSPFYTDRRPISRENYSFVGWKTQNGERLVKQNAWLDAYSFGEDPIWTRRSDVIIEPVWDAAYPFGKIFYGNKESSDYGIIIEEPPKYYWSEKSYTHVEINGKNGDAITNQNRYKNVEKEYKIAVYTDGTFHNAASKVSEFLHKYNGLSNYIRLEDTYEPDIYMLGIYEESNSLENVLNQAGRGTITFNCLPQKFLLSGSQKINITSSGTVITNPTDFSSCPVVNIVGTGTIHIVGKPNYRLSGSDSDNIDISIDVNKNFNEITIDGESLNATDLSGNNANSAVSFYYPIRLYPGPNTITYEGNIVGLSIIPRWWKQ